jgi:hypothetical protein
LAQPSTPPSSLPPPPAQQADLSKAGYASALPTPTPPQATRIETDPKTGSILFIVNGREEARIDAAGLHIRQALEYGTTSQAAAPYHEIRTGQGVK